jgi:hypothetical protein
MGLHKDLTGESKHFLTIVGLADKDIRHNRIMWKALCKCGKETKVCTGDWNAGRAKTCGCSKFRKGIDNPMWKHGKKTSSEDNYKYQLTRRYGIDFELYQLIHDMQDGLCAICFHAPQGKSKRLFVDHCHNTKRVRGLLCGSCNSAIGLLKENSTILNNAHIYVKRNEANNVFA